MIGAARTLLWEKGYEATSPRDIQRLAGVGQGSFYHHFDSKKDLCATALRAVSESMQTDIRAIFDPARPPLDRLSLFLGRPKDGLKGCPMGRMVFDQAVLAEPDLRAPVDAFFDCLRACLEQTFRDAQAVGAMAPCAAPETLALTFIAVTQGAAVTARALDRKTAVSEALAGLRGLLREAAHGSESV